MNIKSLVQQDICLNKELSLSNKDFITIDDIFSKFLKLIFITEQNLQYFLKTHP